MKPSVDLMREVYAWPLEARQALAATIDRECAVYGWGPRTYVSTGYADRYRRPGRDRLGLDCVDSGTAAIVPASEMEMMAAACRILGGPLKGWYQLNEMHPGHSKACARLRFGEGTLIEWGATPLQAAVRLFLKAWEASEAEDAALAAEVNERLRDLQTVPLEDVLSELGLESGSEASAPPHDSDDHSGDTGQPEALDADSPQNKHMSNAASLCGSAGGGE